MLETDRLTLSAESSSVTTIRFNTLALRLKVPSSFMRRRPSCASLRSRPPPPPPVALEELVGLFWPPGPGRVGGDLLALGPGAHHGLEDGPRVLGLVRPDEEGRVAEHQVKEQALVGVRRLLEESRAVEEVHVHRADLEPRARDLRADLQGDPLLRLDTDDEDVGLEAQRLSAGEWRVRRRPELDGDLGHLLGQ